MKTYIVYDSQGEERCYVKAKSHNEAEKLARQTYGDMATVEYTELGPHFDHIKKGFFVESEARQ